VSLTVANGLTSATFFPPGPNLYLRHCLQVGVSYCDKASAGHPLNQCHVELRVVGSRNFHSLQGISQLLKQSDWAQIQDFK